MQYVCEGWLLDAMRGDSAFLRSAGIEPRVRLTEKDARWLRACGVAWEPEPAVQLPLDFCGNHDDVQEIIRLRRSK